MSGNSDAMLRALAGAAGRRVEILRRVPLGGGSISVAERLDTTAGPFVLKSHSSPPEGLFRAEAAGLEALRATGTSLTIPTVVAIGEPPEEWIVLEYLTPPSRGRAQDFDDLLGQGLAALHSPGAEQFGFHADNYCGATRQVNTWTTNWVEFFATARIGYQYELARDAGLLAPSEWRLVDRLIARMVSLIGEPEEGPALIHGDLWSGNLHADASGRPALLDPAAYFGHREAELGMMTLFGGFSDRVFASYHEAFALAPGWRDRNPLYQLYHLLNHLNLFGTAYHGQVMAIVQRYV